MIDINQDNKNKLRAHRDQLAEQRKYWLQKAHYYYNDQYRYFQFLVPEGSSVLVIGCDLGDLLSAIKPCYGVGIDLSPRMITLARERHPEMTFYCMDAENFLIDKKFDVIILTDTAIGQLNDIQLVLEKMQSCCHDRTKIIINYFNYLWSPILKAAERFGLKMPQSAQNWLTPGDITNLLYLAGYDIIKAERRMLIPRSIPILSSILNKFIATLPGIRLLCLSIYLVAKPTHSVCHQKEFSTSVVIPCLNEKGHIEDAISRLPEFGSAQEIIFIDGHSTDGTQEEIQRIIQANPQKNIRFMVQDGKGKGDAVRKAFKSAVGDILMILDADLTVPPEDLPKFYRALVDGKGDFINGCRLIYTMEDHAMRSLNVLGNKFFASAFSWLLNQRIKDTLCGTKVLFKKDYDRIVAGRSYFGNFDPFGDFDLIFGASKLNLKIVELPIKYRERSYGHTNISRFRHGWLLLKMTIFAFFKLKAL